MTDLDLYVPEGSPLVGAPVLGKKIIKEERAAKIAPRLANQLERWANSQRLRIADSHGHTTAPALAGHVFTGLSERDRIQLVQAARTLAAPTQMQVVAYVIPGTSDSFIGFTDDPVGSQAYLASLVDTPAPEASAAGLEQFENEALLAYIESYDLPGLGFFVAPAMREKAGVQVPGVLLKHPELASGGSGARGIARDVRASAQAHARKAGLRPVVIGPHAHAGDPTIFVGFTNKSARHAEAASLWSDGDCIAGMSGDGIYTCCPAGDDGTSVGYAGYDPNDPYAQPDVVVLNASDFEPPPPQDPTIVIVDDTGQEPLPEPQPQVEADTAAAYLAYLQMLSQLPSYTSPSAPQNQQRTQRAQKQQSSLRQSRQGRILASRQQANQLMAYRRGASARRASFLPITAARRVGVRGFDDLTAAVDEICDGLRYEGMKPAVEYGKDPSGDFALIAFDATNVYPEQWVRVMRTFHNAVVKLANEHDLIPSVSAADDPQTSRLVTVRLLDVRAPKSGII